MRSKRFLSTLLAVLMIASVSGCGSSAESNASSSEKESETSTTTTTSATAAKTTTTKKKTTTTAKPTTTTTTTTTTTSATTTTTATTTTIKREEVNLDLYVSSAVNLREGPSTDNNILVVIQKGEKVQASELIADEWYKITYGNYTGYCMAKYLSDKEPATTTTTSNRPVTTTTTAQAPVETYVTTTTTTVTTQAPKSNYTVGGVYSFADSYAAKDVAYGYDVEITCVTGTKDEKGGYSAGLVGLNLLANSVLSKDELKQIASDYISTLPAGDFSFYIYG